MKKTADNSQAALQDILGTAQKKSFLSKRWLWLLTGMIGLILIVVFMALPSGSKNGVGQYITEEVANGNLTVTVSASGTLQPTKSIDVGSEQSGTIASVLVQENDYVKKGQLLAQLDLAKLKDAVTKSKAALSSAEASVAQTKATVAEAKASLSRMRQVAEISGGKVPAKTELDTAEAVLQRAIANLAVANASVIQAQAALKTDETNLTKGAICSPVDGVVLTRKVEPGQSVVAAMTIPVLFILAEDLTKMELQVKVDEADVSNVKIGQSATFSVAAWPSRKFPASIQRVGLGSTITDNVVTYKTVLDVRNDDLALRPGMTATASIVTANRENVLLVPNAALRFTPPQTNATHQDGSILSRLLPHPPAEQKKQNGNTTPDSQQVWVLGEEENGNDIKPRAIPVKSGVSNGRLTEITGGDLKPGMKIITDYQEIKK